MRSYIYPEDNINNHNDDTPGMLYTSVDNNRIVNLKVVSKLKKGEKLNTRLHRFTVEPPGLFSPGFLFRYFNGESRSQTIDAVDALVTSCVTQYGLMARERAVLVGQLSLAAEGVRQLAFTYRDDSTSVAGLELILETIQHYVDVNAQHLPKPDDDTLDDTLDLTLPVTLDLTLPVTLDDDDLIEEDVIV